MVVMNLFHSHNGKVNCIIGLLFNHLWLWWIIVKEKIELRHSHYKQLGNLGVKLD